MRTGRDFLTSFGTERLGNDLSEFSLGAENNLEAMEGEDEFSFNPVLVLVLAMTIDRYEYT